jgi:NAD(P) transhydrogenase
MLKVDLLVLGSGPAGTRAALRARRAGRRVAVVERRGLVGGRCVHTGTIPSKTLRQAIMDLTGYQYQGLYGDVFPPRPDVPMAELRARCEKVIAAETAIHYRMLESRGVEALTGEARFLDSHRVRVECAEGSTDVHGERILIAAGSEPFRPEGIPFDGRRILDSDQILTIPRLPETLAVVGGGVIGSEYAAFFSLLSTDITLIHRGSHLMPFVDDDIIAKLEEILAVRGVHLRTGTTIERYELLDEGVRLTLGDDTTAEFGAVLYCAGRRGSTAGLDLAKAGLAADAHGCLAVDSDFRTAVPHIHAAGDVIGYPSLASVSQEQGRVAACRALDVPCRPVEALLPFGVWTVPEISMVGPTEAMARAQGLDVVAGRGRYEDTARGQILGDRSGLLKLLVDRGTRRLVAAHMIGMDATELIHLAQLAITFEASYTVFIRQVMNYPTLSRVYKAAAWNVLEQLGD